MSVNHTQKFQKIVSLIQNNRFKEANNLIDKILLSDAHNFDALYFKGIIFGINSNHFECKRYLLEAEKINPNHSFLQYNLAKSLSEIGEDSIALEHHIKAVELNPQNHEALLNLGKCLFSLGDFIESLRFYNKAISIKSDFFEAFFNSGLTHLELKDFKSAKNCFDIAIQLSPNFPDCYSSCGVALIGLKNYQDALNYIEKAIQINPNHSESWNNLGNLYSILKRFEDALNCFEKAISINSDFSEAFNNKGLVFKELRLYDDSLANFDLAIKYNSDFADAFINRGSVLRDLKRYDQSLKDYQTGLQLKPDADYLIGMILHLKMIMCDWEEYEQSLSILVFKVTNGNKASPTFPLLALTDSLLVQHIAAKTWINDLFPLNSSLGPITKLNRKPKIKLGYFSSDFREHPVSYLTAELFELHDKSSFELYAFYYGPVDNSEMHKRIFAAFDKFIDISTLSDIDAAILSRDLAIDIAIDLTGLTGDNRVGIFSFRAAPVQLSYIGYLGTMGSPYYDYLIADNTLIPYESQHHYTEKIVYLPSYQVNDSKRVISDKIFTRSNLGLPEIGFVFCCFNSNYKITPQAFDCWTRILDSVPGSVLFIYSDNPYSQSNLINEADKRHINLNRLIFAGAIPRSDYLARYRVCDLFLDTFPYNAGTTASDSLWAGLPVLTMMGNSFASRVAASLLNSLELTELITNTSEEYVSKAIELALNSEKLKVITDKLHRNRFSTPLFNTQSFCCSIESAYRKMYDNYHYDINLENIYISNV
jgi:predicted O-linked N-acetylglucosamine transferase (SPINDLY family)